MSTHHATQHPAEQPLHLAAELAATAQNPARPKIQAPEHANENPLAQAEAEARPPVMKPEDIVPPEVKLPEIPTPEAPQAATPMPEPMPIAAAETPAEPLKLHNVYVMPQVFEQAKVKLFASILPSIVKAEPHLSEGMRLELTNELVDPASEHGVALQITLHGPHLAANNALIAKILNDTLREHPVLGPVLKDGRTHTMSHITHDDGSSELRFGISGLSIAQFAQLVQSLAGSQPMTQVATPAEHHQTLTAHSHEVAR